jgi:hypothetical protein
MYSILWEGISFNKFKKGNKLSKGRNKWRQRQKNENKQFNWTPKIQIRQQNKLKVDVVVEFHF